MLLIVGFIAALALLVFLSMDMIHGDKFKNKTKKSGTAEITNHTKRNIVVTPPGTNIPGGATDFITLTEGDKLTASYQNFDSTESIHTMKINNLPFQAIHLTDGGVFAENNVVRAIFVNGVEYPIIFIQYSPDGRRIPLALLGPGDSEYRYVNIGAKLEVVHPAQENRPLTKDVMVMQLPTKILYDGTSIKVITS